MGNLKIDELITNDIKTVGIAGHMTPDGDCVGGCMALCLYLQKNHPALRVDVFMEPIPDELHIIKGTDAIRTDFQTDIDSYDLFFVVDTANDRILQAGELFDKAKKRVNIDHHVSNSAGCGDINHVIPGASSVCEVLYGTMDTGKMDADIATALYIGMVTDTGIFHYSSTSPETMRVAARLMEFGFDHSEVIEQVQLTRTFSQHRALGMMLTEAKLHLDGRVISAYMDMERMKEEHLRKEDLDQIVSQMNLTAGVECSVFFYDTADGRKKVSLRAGKHVNVATIAEQFGGGGHVRASGCTTDGTVDEILSRILPLVRAQLEAVEA